MPARLPCLDALGPGLPSAGLINRPGAHSTAHGSHSPTPAQPHGAGQPVALWAPLWLPSGRPHPAEPGLGRVGGGSARREAGLGSEGLVFRDGPTRGSRCYATSKCPEGLGYCRATAVLEIHGLPVTVVRPWAGHVTGSSLCVPMVGLGCDLFYFTLFYLIFYVI